MSGTPDLTAAFERLLCRNGVAVVVVTTRAGVELPAHLLGQQYVKLEYELDAVVSIPDLEVTAEGIRATLSFGREPFATFVPWAAVLAMAPMHPEMVETPTGRPKLRAV